MRRIRFFALGIVSFFAVLMGALLAPGTFLNRILSAALCTVFSFSSTVCTVNLAKSSDRVVAVTPPAVERNISNWLVQRAPGEFDDAPSVPAGSNPQAPPFPQDPGPNFPVRPEFDNPNGGNRDSSTGTQSRQCDTEGKIHVFYINGVRTTEDIYNKNSWPIISNVLQETNIKNFEEHTNNYNPSGISLGVGDFLESAIQANIGRALAPSGLQVVNQAVSQIKKIDSDSEKDAKQQAENDCKCQNKKPRYLVIAHSQGNFFAKEIALTLLKAKPEIFQRLSILSIASFTNYQGVIGGLRGGGRFEYMLRSKDFPFRYRDINVPLLTDVSNPGPPNIPDIDSKDGKMGEYQEPSKVLEQSTIKDAALAHGLEGYLGDPSFKDYDKYAESLKKSREEAVNKIKTITSYDPGNYQSEQCQADKQTPQPQQTVQKPSITVTITGPNVIEVNQKTTVEVNFVAPNCKATSVTLRGPSLALPSAKKPIPAESACGGTVSFTVGRFGDNSYGCGEYKNVFGASVSGEGLQLSAYSPPVTVKHKPGSQDYWSCYAWPLD